MPTAAEVFARVAELDDDTLATVTAAFGRPPSASDLSPDELARLVAVIDAVTAGRAAAQQAEHVDPFPPLPPPDVEPLRARVRDLDPAARDACLVRWQQAGLPALVTADGAPAVLDEEQYHAIESIIRQAEPIAPGEWITALVERLNAMPPGPQYEAKARLAAQGIRNVQSCTTTGRVHTATAIFDAVEAQASEQVAAALGPVADPLGEVITTPVDDAADLAEQPPEGKVAEVLAWVGGNPTRARKALDAEQRRNKQRSSLVNKLAPLAVPPATEAPAPASPPGVDVGGEVSGSAPAPSPTSQEMPGQLAIEGTGEAPASVPPVPPPSGPEGDGPASTVAPGPVPPGLDLLERKLDALTIEGDAPVDVEAWPPLKLAAYLGRLGAEMIAGSRQIVAVVEHARDEAKAAGQ